MPKSVLSSITDTVNLLLNTPIVPPLPKQIKDVALTELPHSTPRRHAEALELERSRSVDLAAGDSIFLQGMSDESRRTSTQSRESSDQSARDDVPTGMAAPAEELEHDLHLALDAERVLSQAET
ncbi:uncharacterized protein EDB91DRAFT_1247311 [Suillus paluster]|uniref:uncharacterized protein n=1 Tax=Suillus paluster TaxID=48578 RepID=UPI001B874BD7|nr:uncharacterized protein EDB91DRAFT_1247311 [Suillus paluster]KAG1743231.1 hypothetical protein EDB91DRAFT_1247311 [Suillus paluster]